MRTMSATPFTLRPATATDALCLGVLATQVWLDTYASTGIRPAIAREVLASFSTAAMMTLLQRPAAQVLVAERAAHLIGFAQFTVGTAHPLVAARRPAELDRLYVQEPFTRQGVGGALWAAAVSLAAAAGATHLWLTPWVHNERALRFYARHGCVDVGVTSFVMDHESHQNRVLVKSLIPS